MHLNFLDYVSVQTEGKQSESVNYLKSEYEFFMTKESPTGDPDIVIEFVEETSGLNQSTHVRSPVSYDDRGVFIHDIQYHVLRIDFEAIGHSTCHVTCDINFDQYFLSVILEYLVYFYMLRSDAVFCHSSAFKINDSVVLCPAWRNVGKTNLLLSFLYDGAQYISDDWSVLRKNATVHSLTKRIQLLYYNFDAFPELLKFASDECATLVRFIKLVNEGCIDVDDRTMAALELKARLRLSPYDIFDQKPNIEAVPISHVCLLRRQTSSSTPPQLMKVESSELVSTMSAILEFEQSYFHLAYLAHRAQTGKTNPYLENAKAKSNRIIAEAMEAIPRHYQITVPSRHRVEEIHELILEMLKRDD